MRHFTTNANHKTPIKMKFLKHTFLALVSLCLVLAPVSDLLAARISQLDVEDKSDFVLEPGKIEVFVNKGETVGRTISVINRINRKVKFKIETEDFVGSDNPNTPVVLLGDQKSPYSFKDNLIPELTEFELEFGQKIELPISVTVPEDASPGGYYSSVIISSMPGDSELTGQAGAKIISRIGVLFFVRVNGPVDLEGHLDDFRISGGKTFMQKGPVTFEILFANTGNVHLVPYGLVSVKNIFGKEVARIPVDAYFALPKSMRYRQVTWSKEKLLGRYTAEIKLNRGFEGLEDTKKISFWVIPWTYIVTLLVALFLLTFFWRFVARRFEFRRKIN